LLLASEYRVQLSDILSKKSAVLVFQAFDQGGEFTGGRLR